MVVQVKLPLRYICKKVILRIGEPKKISCTENRNDLIKIASSEHLSSVSSYEISLSIP